MLSTLTGLEQVERASVPNRLYVATLSLSGAGVRERNHRYQHHIVPTVLGAQSKATANIRTRTRREVASCAIDDPRPGKATVPQEKITEGPGIRTRRGQESPPVDRREGAQAVRERCLRARLRSTTGPSGQAAARPSRCRRRPPAVAPIESRTGSATRRCSRNASDRARYGDCQSMGRGFNHGMDHACDFRATQ
jgi:hypothetical protein